MITKDQHMENIKKLQSIIIEINKNGENKNILFEKLLKINKELEFFLEITIAIIKGQEKKIEELNEKNK